MPEPIEPPEGEQTPTPPPAPPVAPAVPPTPKTPVVATAAPLDIAGEINKALDAREAKTKGDEKDKLLETRLEVLEKATAPKKKKWFEPWTLFSG